MKDGGPAFPTGDHNQIEPCFGATLRDFFAAAALQGMIANSADPEADSWGVPDAEGPSPIQLGYMARDAYAIADAMLIARETK